MPLALTIHISEFWEGFGAGVGACILFALFWATAAP